MGSLSHRSYASIAVYWKCHASKRPPDVIVRRNFTRPSTTLAVIEGLGTRLWLATASYEPVKSLQLATNMASCELIKLQMH